MDNMNYTNENIMSSGLPYNNITWKDIAGQPFGTASRFNVIVFNDANNIVDIEGPVAIGGNYNSPRVLSVGFVNKGNKKVGYSPDLVRFLVGGNISMNGPLVVIGHVVGGSGFRAANGSTYFIGKNGMSIQELKYLYQANGGSQYWTPTDKGNHYVVPSYDVPRYIPSSRVGANIPKFFNDARTSISNYKACIEKLTPNGAVINNNYEWILKGNDPVQNVFLIDVRPNGLINKGIRAEVPQGSRVIVRLRTGANAHLQYGVYGEKSKANQTLYVFEDASNIYMEKSSDIWGSILAPQAMFNAHATGGHVSGNAALRAFAVNANSGFEFHYFPFVGGVRCQTMLAPVAPTRVAPSQMEETPIQVPQTPVEVAPVTPIQILPDEETAPVCPTCPEVQPCPIAEPCPIPTPCPTCPTPEPCPIAEPCPTCPTPTPCPTCPTPKPCPTCPTCPMPKPCPPCPTCPEPEKIYITVPMPVPAECPKQKPCPVCQECQIKSGVIKGCIKGCYCGKCHIWEIRLYERDNGKDTFLYNVCIKGRGDFEFMVPFDGTYILKVCQANNRCKTSRCKPCITLNNIGVENLMIE